MVSFFNRPTTASFHNYHRRKRHSLGDMLGKSMMLGRNLTCRVVMLGGAACLLALYSSRHYFSNEKLSWNTEHAGQGLCDLPKASASHSARTFCGEYIRTIIFSWLQQKIIDEKCPALYPHELNQRQSNNLGNHALFFNPLMRSVLLQPCQSPKCLELGKHLQATSRTNY